ncbi:hypothetical protein GYH30_014227 [Glycine max]|uniref:Uncharacterized protein n=1 Tax=Glycine max TaxID=3847 RepID=C6T1C3_SOYBN|nr:unknown [Glycine max]KAH1124399.1 hypothetical protein GYH30_014227 [Glycine max]
MANRHTIILMQASPNRATRTFMDFESITQAMGVMIIQVMLTCHMIDSGLSNEHFNI